MCLNILRYSLCSMLVTYIVMIFPLCREDWKPVLTVNSIIYGLQFLFLVNEHANSCMYIEKK